MSFSTKSSGHICCLGADVSFLRTQGFSQEDIVVLITFFIGFYSLWVFRYRKRRIKQMERHSARIPDWRGLASYFLKTVPEATTAQFPVKFQPGHSGTSWDVDGRVLSVTDAGQAHRAGVEVGMKMLKINGRKFWETLRWMESERDEAGHIRSPGYYEAGLDGKEPYQQEQYQIVYETATCSKGAGSLKAVESRILDFASFLKRLVWPEPARPSALTQLPPEINAEVARCLGLSDLAALSACAPAPWQNFGDSAEVWGTLAGDRNLDVISSWTSDPREAFRCEFFRTDGQTLQRLSAEMPGVGGAGYAIVLAEAAHLARGLMPSDGRQIWEMTCRTAERALQAHNPANEEASAAATEFLQVVRHRRDLVGTAEVERLEDAFSSALQLQAFMDVAMDENVEETVSDSGRSEDSTTSSSRVDANANMEALVSGMLRESRVTSRSSRRMATRSARFCDRITDTALEDMHEMQRNCELDLLLEELRLQTEPA
jgi:hypothetical protein